MSQRTRKGRRGCVFAKLSFKSEVGRSVLWKEKCSLSHTPDYRLNHNWGIDYHHIKIFGRFSFVFCLWPSQSTIYTHPLKAWAGTDGVLGFGHLTGVGDRGTTLIFFFTFFFVSTLSKISVTLILALNKVMKR